MLDSLLIFCAVIGYYRYKKKAVNISKILKNDQRSPKDFIVDWIEYVIKTDGAQHLKVEQDNLWFYELYALDIMLFLTLLSIIVYYVIKYMIAIVCIFLKKQSKNYKHNKME